MTTLRHVPARPDRADLADLNALNVFNVVVGVIGVIGVGGGFVGGVIGAIGLGLVGVELRDQPQRIQFGYALRLLLRSVALRRVLLHSARAVPFQSKAGERDGD